MVEHGRDGWRLASYDWDPETGIATLTYERGRAERTIAKAQPALPSHTGWYMALHKMKF